MAASQGWYVTARRRVINGIIKLPTDLLGVMLVDNFYSFDLFHEAVSSVAPYEITAPGYARKSLTSRSFGYDVPNLRGEFTSDTLTSFGNLGAGGNPIGGVVVFRNVGATDADRYLLSFYKLPITPTNGGVIGVDWTEILHLRARAAS